MSSAAARPAVTSIGFLPLLPAILPGVIFGVGYVVAFNLPFGIRGLSLTGTIVDPRAERNVCKYLHRLSRGRGPFFNATMRSIDEAAESFGASLWQRFAWITLPIMRHAFMLGTLYIFVHGLTTLSAVIFLVSPAYRLASVAIFGASESGHYGSAAAISVTILVIVFAALGIVQWLEEYGPVWARVGATASGR